ncbi:MAG TPA: alpha/beta hydrolase [Polyangia bacterium]|nr:alpha/beta hydrolase [Polyangia bacterium]
MRIKGEGPARLLVHGLFTSGLTFDRTLERLPPGCMAVALDLPVAGGSVPAPGFEPGWFAFADAVLDVADALDLERFDLVGHSMGGGISLAAAARHPDRVRRLVLVDAVTHPFPLPFKGRLPLVPGLGAALFRLYGERMFVDYFARDVFHDRATMDLGKVRRHYGIFDGRRAEALACLRATADPSPIAALAQAVRCPTLAIWGEHDRLVPLEVGRRLVREIPGARLEIVAGSGHSPLEERPDEAAALVNGFLDGPG